MSEKKYCPNCQTEIKHGLISMVDLLPEDKTKIINEYIEQKSSGYCNKCGSDLYESMKEKYYQEKEQLITKITNNLNVIPVVTIHSPLNWKYSVIGLVTAQVTAGTGVLTELTSSFSDFFGMESKRHNMKLKQAEDLCLTQLRKYTLDMGGTAVIASDIDYAEIGGAKNILMVCMSGTAVDLLNFEILEDNLNEKINELHDWNDRLNYLNEFRILV